MPKRPCTVHAKLHTTAIATFAVDRVVTTHSESTLQTSYRNVLLNMPKSADRWLDMCHRAHAELKKFANKKYASSRDAANDGSAALRYIMREQQFYDLATKGLGKFATTEKERAVFRSAFALDQRKTLPISWKTAANPIYRLAFGKALALTLSDWAERTQRECYLITIINQNWHTTRANPKVDIAGMKAAVDQVLSKVGWEGLLFVEVQGLRAQTKDLLPHFHGIICPSKRSSKQLGELRAALAQAFPDVELAEGVVLHLARSPSDVVNFLLYAAKSPSTIKRIYKSKDAGSVSKTREGTSNYSSRFALDILEIRSMLTMSDLAYARGKVFAELLETVLSATERVLKARGISATSPDFVALRKVWVAIRRRNPERKVPSTYGKKRPTILR